MSKHQMKYERQKVDSLEKKVKTLTEKLLDAFEELNIFYDVNQSLSNIYNIQEICDIALSQIAEIVCSEKASMALVDEDKKHLTIMSCRGFIDNPVGKKIRIEDTLYNKVIKEQKTLFCDDQIQHLSLSIPTHQYKTKYFVLHPLCALPMTVREEVIGTISLSDKVDKQPFTAQDIKFLSAIAFQTAIVIKNARLVTNLKNSFLITVRSLSAAIDAKDPYTYGHSERVSKYALGIGKTLGIPQSELEQLELACLLHDVGKIGIPEEILNKTGVLSANEMDIIRQHPLKGVEILKDTNQPKSILAVRNHHERYDGHGYPDNLFGEEIPLLARIISVADSYDAMSSDRPYRSKCSLQKTLSEIRKGSGIQYDPKMVWAFMKHIKCIGISKFR